MKSKYCRVMLPRFVSMMTGMVQVYLEPNMIRVWYSDGTIEEAEGRHSFACFQEGDEVNEENFKPFAICQYVQSKREVTA